MSVKRMADRLGLVKPTPRYTKEEKQFVHDNIGLLPYHEIGKRLGKSERCIQSLVQREGWNDDQIPETKIRALREDYRRDSQQSYSALGRKYGMSRGYAKLLIDGKHRKEAA